MMQAKVTYCNNKFPENNLSPFLAVSDNYFVTSLCVDQDK